MRLRRAFPPGEPAEPRDLYTGLRLSDRAPADRPYVVGNFISSADGKATASGRSAALGGAADREVFHLLRTQVDAVMAGSVTLRIERYGALVRSEEKREIRVAEGRDPQPLAVIVSRSGRIPFDIPLFSDPGSRVALYAPSGTATPDCAAEIIGHELPSPGERLDPEHMLVGVMRSLREDHGVGSLLCEGGPVLFNAMLVENLVDELFLTLAPALVGAGELPITAGSAMPDLLPLQLIWASEQGGSLFLRYARAESVG